MSDNKFFDKILENLSRLDDAKDKIANGKP